MSEEERNLFEQMLRDVRALKRQVAKLEHQLEEGGHGKIDETQAIAGHEEPLAIGRAHRQVAAAQV